jgi:hypothetical protein
MSETAEDSIEIECRPYDGFFYKWLAEAKADLPHLAYGYTYVKAYGKTADEAIGRVKTKLCKLTAKEERKAKAEAEWRSEFKRSTFNQSRDCSS